MKTFLKISFILFNFTTYSFFSNSQTKSIYIQIDTIVTFDKYETSLKFKVEELNESHDNSTSSYKINDFPNFTGNLYIDSDSSQVKIPVDNKGSYIVLENVYKIDTLLIQKFEYFNTQPPDSTFETRLSYKLKNDKRDSIPNRIERKLKTKKIKSPPKNITLTINNEEYKFNLKLIEVPHSIIINGHGYNRNNPYKRNGKYKNRLTSFDLTANQLKYYWVGRILLE
ncbi:hypothetical protein [Brumimicrobium mesophilum]|uniref:hypothetical protein n=1 Tax=Brumimicrobium mesophilum TaxID=392717 RepID=UPI000D14408F|nr:hypothetical protein [Brumimicrobium mesophilum]